ncbi:hypothetical protein CA850_24850 [Micromonospora echinospora]|uniref:hypothetical protein n=1 Tax=Micromonospora echinospora TaxID=1877 RepID=UPI000BD9AD1A|nr:hypothetical protein [Micromonospora echinospora]OZV77044.1 hypothetical protein CA850_24850 [Micromonospora echinospora]
MAVRLAAVSVTVAAALVVPTPAQAAGTAGHCPDASGVTVVVDFNELGGGTVVRCAPGAQASGLAALKNAGFQVTGTLRWGEGFICRIEGKPSAATEKCVDTPPANAYWSYWHADNGGSWRYSDKGVLNRRPPAGSFEGWSFSRDRSPDDAPRPGVAPTRPAPPRPSPSPPAPSDGATPPAPAAPSRTERSVPTAASTTPPTITPATSALATPTAPAPTGLPVTPGTGGTAAAPTAGPAERPVTTDVAARRDDGLPLGTVTGVLLLAALAGGGILAVRRRRATDPDD